MVTLLAVLVLRYCLTRLMGAGGVNDFYFWRHVCSLVWRDYSAT